MCRIRESEQQPYTKFGVRSSCFPGSSRAVLEAVDEEEDAYFLEPRSVLAALGAQVTGLRARISVPEAVTTHVDRTEADWMGDARGSRGRANVLNRGCMVCSN